MFKRVLCRELARPSSDVLEEINDDILELDDNECRETNQRIFTYNPQKSCYGCHQHVDPIGFAFETFNFMGQLRGQEADKPNCKITGEGDLPGYGSFTGLSQMMEKVTQKDELKQCFVRRVLEHGYATAELSSIDVEVYFEGLPQFRSKGTLSNLLSDIVKRESFSERIEFVVEN